MVLQQSDMTTKKASGAGGSGVKTTLRLPADLVKQLKYKALDENTTVTDLAIRALKEYLKK